MRRSIPLIATLLILGLIAVACGGASPTAAPTDTAPPQVKAQPTDTEAPPTPTEAPPTEAPPTPTEEAKQEVGMASEVYKKSPWWPYISAHMDVESPPDLVGGPIELQITQESGGTNWVFPGPRKLDPTIFGTVDNPKGLEVPPIILGAPMKVRKTLEDGTFVTGVPTPFSNKVASTQGALDLRLVDATATDGAATKDQVDMVATFEAPGGKGTYRVEVKKAAPHGWFIPTGGGVVTNFIQHGLTKWGTQLMPTEYSYASFWGLGDIYLNDEKVDENRVVHGMLTEYVRKEPYDLVWDDEVNPRAKHFHLMIPPFTPQGEQKPVKTGFTLPNGQQQPFFHVMFPSITTERLSAVRTGVVASHRLPATSEPVQLKWTTAEEVFGSPETSELPQQAEPYKQSPWWPYLSAHADVDEPPQVLGGPIQIEGIQESGGANWVFPGPRRLDPAIFGTEDGPKATEVPPLFLGAPMQVRNVLEDGAFVTNVPTPFSDKVASTRGSVEFTVVDATAVDGAATQDQIDFVATFEAPNDQGTYRIEVKKPAPHGWVYPTGGGVATNFVQHGVTKWGTQLMPTEYSYMSFWGLGDIYLNDEKVDGNRAVHVMLTEYVREEPYNLVFDEGVNPNAQHLHLMVAPFTPKGEPSPVKTGFKLPNGMEQPFFHVMFPSVELNASLVAGTPAKEEAGEKAAGDEQEAAAPATPETKAGGDVRVIEVTAKSFEFDPGAIEIKKGETVRFVARSEDIYHTFSVKRSEDAEENIFSLDLYPEEGPAEIEFTAQESGTLYLYCTPHEALDMTGTIKVVP